MVFIRAEEGPPNFGEELYTVQYFDENGNMTIRSGGTKAWRNNNPGNMIHIKNGFAVRHGAIGEAKGMAVFPSEKVGRQALIDLLKKEGVIQEYLIKKEGRKEWVTKKEAVRLAKQGRLHAVIVHGKNGCIFLRPECGAKPFLVVET